jgi:starch synthase
MARPSIMMVSSEASPWAKTGGLGEVVGALPAALARLGHPVSVVIPRYLQVHDAAARRVLDRISIRLGAAYYFADIWRMDQNGVTLYFVDNPALYGRDGLYGDRYGEYPDNHIRFAFLNKAALEISRRLFPADVFHCHDWQAGLLPVYLKESGTVDPAFLGAKTLLTIHNLGYQGLFPRAAMADISLPERLFRTDRIEFWQKMGFLKAGLVYADALTTVSPTYAKEIQTVEYGAGLDGLLRERRASLTGILNGVDYGRWNPSEDPAIAAPYSPTNLAGKEICKRELLREMGLPESALNRPLLGIVSRFAGQKGIDLIADIAAGLFEENVSLVALGDGETRYEEFFTGLQAAYPDKVALRIGYDDPLAHRIEAGADIFLMPSLYEPCGLNQIYSLRYGTVPVVRATGGLEDTIDATTGFKFSDYNGEALLLAIQAACRAWLDRTAWRAMMVSGMHRNFSWAVSAVAYSRLYGELHPCGGVGSLI